MGLEEVEADIRKKVESKVNTIKNSAEKEAYAIIEDAKNRVKELKKVRENEIDKLIGETRSSEIAAAKLSARKLKLDAKRDLIERVYTRIKEKLSNLDESEKEEILGLLIARAKKELENAKYVSCNSGDKKIVEKIASKAGLRFDSEIECSGGVIIENSDRTVRVDYTFDGMHEIFKNEKLREVSQKLFLGGA